MFENGNNGTATNVNNGYNGAPGYGTPYYPGMMPGAGFNYTPQQPAQQPKQYSFLTPEEIKNLMDKGPGFNLKLTGDEKTRGICNHRSADGTHDTLQETEDGSVYCSVCGYKFKTVDMQSMTVDEVQESVDGIIDILQTIKMIYIDLNPQDARDYFQIIPMLEKIPKLYELAIANYSRHEQFGQWHYDGKNMSAAKLLDAVASAINGGYNLNMMQQPYYQDPNMMQQPYSQPNGAPVGQQFMGQPNPAFQQAPIQQPYPSNGFGYYGAAPMQQPYQAQNVGYQYSQPNGAPVAQQQATPAAAPNTAAQKVETKTVTS